MERFKKKHLDYFHRHLKAAIPQLALKKSPFSDLSNQEIVQQVQGLQIAQKKFPSFLNFAQFRFPPKLNLEQSSSEVLAQFKSKLVEGESFADLTGGFGVDTYWIGKNFKKFYHIEPNRLLQELVQSNFKVLALDNGHFYNGKAEQFLSQLTDKIDWIFIDPSRRTGGDRKIGVANYEPNIYELQQLFLEKASNVLIKISPMQDIAEVVESIDGIQKVILCEWQKELKEILLVINSNPIDKNNIDLEVNHLKSRLVFSKKYSKRTEQINTGEVSSFVFEPGPALQKSGLVNSFGVDHQLWKLQRNSQLLFSEALFVNPLGKSFEIIAVESLSKKKLRPYLSDNMANVIVRNFPIKAAAIKQKLGIKEGGSTYLIATTDGRDKAIILVAKRH